MPKFIKSVREGGLVVKVTRSIIFGKRRGVETQAPPLNENNLTLRQGLRRLARKTLAFSKNRRELQHALDFIDAYDNFVKPHGALRLKSSSEGNRLWMPRSPTMAAGISDQI